MVAVPFLGLYGYKVSMPGACMQTTKVDGLENIEKRSPPLEVTLGSSTGTNHAQRTVSPQMRFFWPILEAEIERC